MEPTELPHMSLAAMAFVWYTKEEWAKVKADAVDSADMHASYEDWKRDALSCVMKVMAQGGTVHKINIVSTELKSWLNERNLQNNDDGRMAYVAFRARESSNRLGK